MLRRVGAFVLVALLTMSLGGVAAAAVVDEDTHEVCAYYAGEFSAGDSQAFRNKFSGSPTNYAVKDYEEWSVSPDQVTVEDLKDGETGDYGIDDGDLAYYSSHGHDGSNPYFEIWHGNPYTSPPVSPYWVADVRTHDIGDDWIEEVDYWGTNSALDSDFEWLFLAACEQLSTSYSFVGPKGWGRVLCGYPRRGHGVFGYSGLAPGDGTDVNIVNRLYQEGVTYGNTIKDSWVTANAAYGCGTKWACVVHSANLADHFWGAGSVTADTSPTSSPAIYFYNSSYSSGTEIVRALRDSLARLFSPVASANAIYGPRKMRVTCPLPGMVRVTDTVARPEPEPQEGWERVLLGPGARPEESKGDAVELWVDGDWVAEVLPSGGVKASRPSVDEPCDFGAREAARVAASYVEAHGGLPEGCGKARVALIRRTELDVVRDKTGRPDTVGYLVEYPHIWHGLEVGGDTIRLILDQNGVNFCLRNWHVLDEAEPKSASITAEQAVKAGCENVHLALKVPEGAAVTAVRPAMYVGTISERWERAVPVWDIVVEDEGHIYVDALTGEVIG